MAYAELLGSGDGGLMDAGGSCDGGVAFAASTECACVSRVVPGDVLDSYLVDVLDNSMPASCAANLAMPIASDGGWAPLSVCDIALIAQWVTTGAQP
jgi:hypothetical protein